jgi:beta-RFAP synthase
VASLVARVPFPEAWRVLVVIPPWGSGRHGTEEGLAFQQLQAQPADQLTTDRLCRLVLLGMLPALAEGDPAEFGEALYEFNAISGQLFAAVQGGTYADARIAQLVAALRDRGVRGVGQSSWGPAVFAVVNDLERARTIAAWVREGWRLSENQVILTGGCNSGARVGRSDAAPKAGRARGTTARPE